MAGRPLAAWQQSSSFLRAEEVAFAENHRRLSVGEIERQTLYLLLPVLRLAAAAAAAAAVPGEP